jgi:hypothetical protein
VFNVLHVSQLRKCLRVPEERVPIRSIEIKFDLTYEEEPVQGWIPKKELLITG